MHSLYLCLPLEAERRETHDLWIIFTVYQELCTFSPGFPVWIKPYSVFHVVHLTWCFWRARSPLSALTGTECSQFNGQFFCRPLWKYFELVMSTMLIPQYETAKDNILKVAFTQNVWIKCWFHSTYFYAHTQLMLTFVLEKMPYLGAAGFSCFRVSISVNCTACPPLLVLKTSPWRNFKRTHKQ